MRKIDTHQHLLYPNQFGYAWTDDFPDLQHSFSLEGYEEASAGCEIERTLFMEVDVDPDQHRGEAAHFCRMAEDPSNNIAGVIAKSLPESADFLKEIESIQHPALKGIRRVLHTQADGLSQSTLFRQQVAALEAKDLSFDLCVTQKQLQVALELVRACPGVRFILDHCGMPSIAEHTSFDCESWQQWRSGIHALGQQPNVACKLSGITAYAAPEQRSTNGLRPYLNEMLEAFGPGRIVWGGDWPVCNLADGLAAWSDLTDALLAELSPQEQAAICIENALRVYKLS